MTLQGKDGGLLGGNSLSGEEYSDTKKTMVEVAQGAVRGVFSNNPACTPKYHTGNTQPSLERMARLFVPLSDNLVVPFLESVPDSARPLAQALVVADNTNKPVGTGWGYIDFLLQSASEQFQEKEQVVQTVGDNYISYYYGQQPPVFTYSGTLLNSEQDDWRAAFTLMYNEILRGTKLARRKAVVTLAYDDVFVTGVMRTMGQTLTADFELMAQFQFSMLVKRYDIHSRVKKSFLPTPVLWPYRMLPSDFSNVPIEKASKSIWNAGEVKYTTVQRKKNTENTKDDSMLSGIEPIKIEPDPKVEYVNSTVYNAAVKMVAAAYTGLGSLLSGDIDSSFFKKFSDYLPPDKD